MLFAASHVSNKRFVVTAVLLRVCIHREHHLVVSCPLPVPGITGPRTARSDRQLLRHSPLCCRHRACTCTGHTSCWTFTISVSGFNLQTTNINIETNQPSLHPACSLQFSCMPPLYREMCKCNKWEIVHLTLLTSETFWGGRAVDRGAANEGPRRYRNHGYEEGTY